MKNKNATLLLFRTMIRATEPQNVMKYSKDKKARSRARGGVIGIVILRIVLLALGIAIAYGFVRFGMADRMPALAPVVVFGVSFVLTLLKSSGYLFGLRDYDMLISMPFSVKNVVGSKFLYMYYHSLFLNLVIPAAMLVGYGIAGKLTIVSAIMWIIMMPFLPVIPMILASAIGTLVTVIGARASHKTLVRTVLTLIVMIPLIFGRTIAGGFVNNYLKKVGISGVLAQTSDLNDRISGYVPGASWFTRAVTGQNILCFLLMIVVPVIVYEIFFLIVSRFYRRINSRLAEGGARKGKKAVQYGQHSISASIAMKEWKRMTGSTTYTVNAFLGEILALAAGVIALFISPDKILSIIFKNAPVQGQMVVSVIPFLIYALVGLVATTAITPSLEGKNYWIIQSLPISVKDDCKGKARFNISLMLPIGLFSTAVLSLKFGAGVQEIILNLVLITALVLFSTAYGLWCGIRYRKLNWENEAEVVKQGAALAWYMFPNLIAALIFVIGSIFLGVSQNYFILQIAQVGLVPAALLLALLFWKKAIKKAEHAVF